MSILTSDLRGDQLAPHSIEAEEAVLGSILINPEAKQEVSFLTGEDFFIVRHEWIWEAFNGIAKRGDPLDYLTVINELEQTARISEIGGAAMILSLINKTPSALNVEGYGRIVQRMAMRRRLLAAAQQIARVAHSDETDIAEVMSRSSQAMKDVEDYYAGFSGGLVQDIAQIIGKVSDRAAYYRANPALVRGVPSGLSVLDDAFGGFEARELTFLAARPGMGKSGMIARITRGAAAQGHSVLLFNLEMTELSMVDRMACQLAQVDSRGIKRGSLTADEYRRYDDALAALTVLPIKIVARGMLPFDDIMAMTKAELRIRPVDLVLIDTLNKIKNEKGDSLYQQMSNLTNRLSGWALDSTFHVLVAAQLSRANMQRADKLPQLSDLRDSGTVEQDADNVIFLHRDYAYDQSDVSKRNEARFIIAKRREGQVGSWKMWWTPESTNFETARVDRVELDDVVVHGRD